MKAPKTYWNHRIITRLLDGERVFSVVEVHYRNNKPVGYGAEHNLLSSMESIKGLKWTLKKVKRALKRSIIDADNFPKKYKK